MRHCTPRLRSSQASVKPFGPAPIMITGKSFVGDTVVVPLCRDRDGACHFSAISESFLSPVERRYETKCVSRNQDHTCLQHHTKRHLHEEDGIVCRERNGG